MGEVLSVNEVLRQERKMLITATQMYRLKPVFSQVMMEDQHGAEEGYIIRSLYFDTIDDKDFHDKEDGVLLRRKIRLRNYGQDSNFALLEMKQKEGANQKKRSLKMNVDDAKRLINRDYFVLLSYDDPFAAECFGIMNSQCYLPKAVVEYKRKAYVAKENRIRVTFDSNIVCTESCFDIFSEHLLQNSCLDPSLAVLEVKYNGFLLSYIKDILQMVNESELSVSKYSLSRSVSMHYNF